MDPPPAPDDPERHPIADRGSSKGCRGAASELQLRTWVRRRSHGGDQCSRCTLLPLASPPDFVLWLLALTWSPARTQIVHSSQVDVQIRQLSAVLCRRYISNHWIRQKPDFQEPEVRLARSLTYLARSFSRLGRSPKYTKLR